MVSRLKGNTVRISLPYALLDVALGHASPFDRDPPGVRVVSPRPTPVGRAITTGGGACDVVLCLTVVTLDGSMSMFAARALRAVAAGKYSLGVRLIITKRSDR